MFYIKPRDGGIDRFFFNGSVIGVFCKGNRADAERDASDLALCERNYGFIRKELDEMFKEFKDYKLNKKVISLNEMDKRGKYMSHFLAHGLFLLFQKLNEINGDGELIKVSQELSSKYETQLSENNIGVRTLCANMHYIKVDAFEGFAKIIDSFQMALLLFPELGACWDLLNDERERSKNIEYSFGFEGMVASLNYLWDFHKNLLNIAEILSKACKIEEVQKDPSLGTRVCKLYKKMECFLDKNYIIDKEEYDRILEGAEKAEAQEKINSWVKDTKRIVDLLGGLDLSKVNQEDCQALLTSCEGFVESQRKKDGQVGEQLERADSSRSLDMEMDHSPVSTKI